MPLQSRFSFVDESEALRLLRIDRPTFEQLLKEGRLKPVRGVGKDAFYRTSELEALYKELHPQVESEEEEGAVAGKKVKQHDPAMRVHLRLQADLKWLEVSEEDIRQWFQEVRSDAYQRYQNNIRQVMVRLQMILDLIGEAQRKEVGQEASAVPPGS
jgi:hypothetical protein